MRAVLAAVILAFVAGLIHGRVARDRALHSSLRAELESQVGGASIDRIDVLRTHEPIRLRARLTEDANDAGEFVSLRVDSTALAVGDGWRRVSGGVMLSVNGAEERTRIREWTAGRIIEAPVTFRRPARYLNDGVPDLEADAALNGLTLFGSVKSPLLIDVVHKGTVLKEHAAHARAAVRAAVARWVLPHGEISAAIVSAILIGDRTGLPDDVRTRLQAAGTYHVIAISGGNIAILAALVIGGLTLAGIHRSAAAAVTILALVAYAGIVTAGPSVWRATLMAVLYFGARTLDHRTPAWHALIMSAGIIAAAQPLDVRDAGFLLTFGATAGLLGAGRLATSWLPDYRLVTWLVASIVASLAVELVLLPVSADAFSRVTAAGLVLNLVAIPAMAVVQVAGMIVVAFVHVKTVAGVAGWLAAHGASMLVDSARLVDDVPALVHRVPPPAAWTIAAYYAALFVAWRSVSRVRIGAWIALAVAGVLIVTGFNPLATRPRADRLRLTMIDVGQGESMLLEMPGAEPVLIDTGGSPFGGGSFDLGSRVLAPALWARHVRRLGTLLVTHGDPDHLGGATATLSDFTPHAVWWGTPVPPHDASRGFLAMAAQKSVVAFRRAEEQIEVGTARIRVLHPSAPEWERQKVRNDDSVVLEVVYHDVALLLTGDISADIERLIAPQLTSARVRVLKVAHHGSRTSSSRALLESWRPQIALISCGRGNTFGHPAPDVLERLESIGARVYRTDRDGEVTLETDGRAVSVRTFVGGQP